MKKERILFIGPPGCGKGTQAQFLKKYGFVTLSTGELLREAFKKKNPLVLPYKKRVEAGALLPDTVLFKILQSALKKIPQKKHCILDGAVRTRAQAQKARTLRLFTRVFYFALPQKITLERLEHRREVAKEKRKDDKVQARTKRLTLYRRKTLPAVQYLKKHAAAFYTIDAKPSPQRIHKELKNILGLK